MASWRTPELDRSAADALAVLTLYASGRPEDAALAGDLLDDLVARPDGVESVIGGLVSISAALLALLEHQAAVRPPDALDHLGRLVLQLAGERGEL